MWVKFHDELCQGAKRGLPRAVRFVYMELSLLSRPGRGTIDLPVGMTPLAGVRDLLGGNAKEVATALQLLTKSPDPMVRIEGDGTTSRLVVTKWETWNVLDASTARVQKHRKNKANKATSNADVTRYVGVTPPFQSLHSETSETRPDQIRVEEIREEKEEREAAGAAPGGEPPGSPDGPPVGEREPDPDPVDVAPVPLTLTASPGGAEVAPRRDIPAEVHRAYLDGWTRYVGKGTPPTLDAKRRKLIVARLKDFTPDELCDAARGAWASEWHREDHAKRMRLDQVYASTGRVEQFIAALAPSQVRTSDNGGYGRVIDRPAPARYVPKVEPMKPFPNLFGFPDGKDVAS